MTTSPRRAFMLAVLLLASSALAAERVLSIGNSLIEFNTQSAIIEQLAASGGKSVFWYHRSSPGQSLQYHWDQGTQLDGAGFPTARMLIRQGGWTHIVLQEYSNRPLVDPQAFFTAVRLFKAEIDTFSPGANILLYENWPYNDSPDYAGDLDRLNTTYNSIASEISARIIPVGHAFASLRKRNGPFVPNPYVLTDDKHPSIAGSYISACVIYGFLYQKSPFRLSYFPSDLNIKDARILQQRAWQSLKKWLQQQKRRRKN